MTTCTFDFTADYSVVDPEHGMCIALIHKGSLFRVDHDGNVGRESYARVIDDKLITPDGYEAGTVTATVLHLRHSAVDLHLQKHRL